MAELVDVVCVQCGKTFGVKVHKANSYAKNGTRHYCSDKCRKAFRIANPELFKHVYERKKKQAEQKLEPTLCWDCWNSLGNCPWSREFKPVPGWEVVEVKRKYTVMTANAESLTVISCPMFTDKKPKIDPVRSEVNVLMMTMLKGAIEDMRDALVKLSKDKRRLEEASKSGDLNSIAIADRMVREDHVKVRMNELYIRDMYGDSDTIDAELIIAQVHKRAKEKMANGK